MNYKIIKMTSRTNVVKYRFEIFVELGEHTEVIVPHLGFLTEQALWNKWKSINIPKDEK
jgi:hypothetical protein